MSTLCLRCGYSLTEPICASCVINEIKVWFYKQPLKNKMIRNMNKELDHLLKKVESLDYARSLSRNIWNFAVMRCIRCRKEIHLMCFYCVTNQASQIVIDNLRNKDFIERFQESFNTELYDHKLSKENNFH